MCRSYHLAPSTSAQIFSPSTMSASTSITVSFFLFLVLIHAAVSFVPRALSPSFSTSNLCPTFSPCSAPTVTLLRSSNDPTNPSLDEDGYTLYTDPETNSTGRVFEKLVDYPSVFTIKVVGENTPTFTPDMIDLVNEVRFVVSCRVVSCCTL